jgi:hypothetical protein
MSIISRSVVVIGALLAVGSQASAVDPGKYQITEAERAACQGDATLLCSATFPDQDLLLACMRAHQDSLSSSCKTTFRAGLRRRHLL